MNEFYTIENSISTVFIEKKSKFIATIFHINTDNEAKEFIKQINKKYHDARHNCYAYRVIENGYIVEKSSDNGEPSGTAGAPMLDIIKKNNLCNVVIIVTRYFGGILLGTGGLVRAYTDATLKAINNSQILLQVEGWIMDVELDYKDLENFKYYCKNNNIYIKSIKYLEDIVCKIELENETKDIMFEDIEIKKLIIKEIKNLCKNFINKSVKK